MRAGRDSFCQTRSDAYGRRGIGANLGWFTAHLAKIVGLNGRVDAFEPLREVIDFAENDGIGAVFLAILDSDLW